MHLLPQQTDLLVQPLELSMGGLVLTGFGFKLGDLPFDGFQLFLRSGCGIQLCSWLLGTVGIGLLAVSYWLLAKSHSLLVQRVLIGCRPNGLR